MRCGDIIIEKIEFAVEIQINFNKTGVIVCVEKIVNIPWNG